MAYPDNLETLPDPATRTEADGLTLRQKLVALLTPYRTVIHALENYVGIRTSTDNTSIAYQLARSREDVITFTHSGNLAVGAGGNRFLLPWGITILGVTATVGTAPTGSAATFDVNKNGTTIFTTQANRPSIAAGAYVTAAERVPDLPTILQGDYLTVDRDAIGSTVPGADASVFIRYRKT